MIDQLVVNMMKLVNAALASSRDPSKITTKLQNTHHWESPETEILQPGTHKRGHPELGGEVETQNRLDPYLHVAA